MQMGNQKRFTYKSGQADDTPVEKCVYFITKQGDDL